MKVLIGVPVFRIPTAVVRCINSINNSKATVLVVDNNADQNVKEALRWYGDRIRIIVNQENLFCNGAWNQILEVGIREDFDLIGLGTDATLREGWYDVVLDRATSHTDEVLIPSLNTSVSETKFVTEGLPGYFSILPRKAAEIVYPIPENLRHWYGDQYMFEKLRSLGWKTAILRDFVAYHEFSIITAAVPEAYEVIKQDGISFRKNQETK